MNSEKKLYILTSNKLSVAYQGVQGGHALAEWLIKNPQNEWNNGTLVYLSCDIEKWFDKLYCHSVDFCTFYEPDIDNELTALATYSDGRMFKNLKLMGT